MAGLGALGVLSALVVLGVLGVLVALVTLSLETLAGLGEVEVFLAGVAFALVGAMMKQLVIDDRNVGSW